MEGRLGGARARAVQRDDLVGGRALALRDIIGGAAELLLVQEGVKSLGGDDGDLNVLHGLLHVVGGGGGEGDLLALVINIFVLLTGKQASHFHFEMTLLFLSQRAFEAIAIPVLHLNK